LSGIRNQRPRRIHIRPKQQKRSTFPSATAGRPSHRLKTRTPDGSRLLVPYLGGVGFATALNGEAVRLNPRVR
jgi:hypothetical protein